MVKVDQMNVVGHGQGKADIGHGEVLRVENYEVDDWSVIEFEASNTGAGLCDGLRLLEADSFEVAVGGSEEQDDFIDVLLHVLS